MDAISKSVKTEEGEVVESSTRTRSSEDGEVEDGELQDTVVKSEPMEEGTQGGLTRVKQRETKVKSEMHLDNKEHGDLRKDLSPSKHFENGADSGDVQHQKGSKAEGKNADNGAKDREKVRDDHKHQYEVTYSTRGRSHETSEPTERDSGDQKGSTGEALQDAQSTSTPSAPRESFLSDSLTEEERRTRTRYLPNVSGMHMLRKHEIKGDLALARAIPASTGTAPSTGKRRSGKRNDPNGSAIHGDSAMVVDDNGISVAVPHSEDEKLSDLLRLGGRTIDLGTTELSLPTAAFVAPSADQLLVFKTGKEGRGVKRSPREVESVTSFNPPRPPESVGGKKKHRLLRWERCPGDIEVDLNNYRKTVHRTQQELHSAQAERDRIETVENHLRNHFLHYLQDISVEMEVLNSELSVLQQECVNEADLLTARTRNRGAGKGNLAMKDVLGVLKNRGEELAALGRKLENKSNDQLPVGGAGGVSAVNFDDWDQSAPEKAQHDADNWIVPGENVISPYGEGIVVAFHPSDPLDEKRGSPEDDGDLMDVDSSPPTGSSAQDKESSALEGKVKTPDAKSKEKGKDARKGVRAPRVGVQLPYGVAYFPLQTLKKTETPSKFPDEKLAQRWKGLHETAKEVASVLDAAAMESCHGSDSDRNGDAAMETDRSPSDHDTPSFEKRRLLPFGAEMLPSAHGRGNLLLSTKLEELEKSLEHPLYNAEGLVGIRNNRSLPRQMVDVETLCEEKLLLQAKANQLRNKLNRQRRIRIFNDRILSATQERAGRVESLVAEMRTDLKSLKSRLDEEIRDLGVTSEQADRILATYSKSLETEGSRHTEQTIEYDSEDDVGMEEESGDVGGSYVNERGEVRQ